MGSAPTPAPETALCRNGCGQTVPVYKLWDFTIIPWCDECVKADDEEEQQRRAAVLLSRANVPKKMRAWSLATFPRDHAEAEAAWQAATDWHRGFLAGETHNLLLFGPVGVGKSGLAWSLIRATCEQGTDSMFLNLRDYLWSIRDSFRTNEQVDRRAHSIPLLALDDLGAERPTDFARDELATLVEHRTGAGLPTIVTSNYAPDELARRLGHDDLVIGQRIVSRLVQDAVQFRVEGMDRRLPV
jgi:DNA replication protein DnaC